MLVIRFSRVGKRNHPQYKVVVAEKSAPIKGRFVEQLGSYNPHQKVANLKADRIEYWISKGASCSDSTYNLFVKEGLLKGKARKLSLTPKKSKGEDSKSEEKKEEPDSTKSADKKDETNNSETQKKSEEKVTNVKQESEKEPAKKDESKSEAEAERPQEKESK